jgi:hypothetical protein
MSLMVDVGRIIIISPLINGKLKEKECLACYQNDLVEKKLLLFYFPKDYLNLKPNSKM